MIKKLYVAIALLAISFANAQQGSVSPYSFFGTGDLRFKGLMENRSMGGISVYTDSIHLNILNPSALGRMKLTTYTAAVSYQRVGLKTETQSESISDASFEYLALGFPISDKIGVNFGVLPYTAVGYNVQDVDTISSPNRVDRFTGNGGLNRVFFSAGYEIYKNISIGATMNFNFGRVENQNLEVIQDVQYGTRELNRSDYSGFDFNLAASYRGFITDKLELHASAMYAPEATLSSSNFREISTIFVTGNGQENVVESQEVDLASLGLNSTDLTKPVSYTVGLGIGKPLNWFIGGEYEIRKTGDFENEFFQLSNGSYEDGERVSIGAFWTPDYNSFTSYFKRVTYRLGFRNERTGLIVNNVPVHNLGMTFGLGLPLGNFSNANIGFEYGKRGSTFQGRIEENYFNIFISLSLNDRWFRKQLIN